MNQQPKHWDIEIGPSGTLLYFHFKDLWRFRYLLWLFVKRDIISFYKQTILGPVWYFIQPLLVTVVFTFVFGSVANLSTDGVPRPLFYLSGITLWNYFADCIAKTSTVFRDNAYILSKVYFPRIIMPLSIILSNLLKFSIQLVLLFSFVTYYFFSGEAIKITPIIILLPFLICLMAILGLASGLIIASLTVRYRDLSFLVGFGVQLLMFITTVIYPISAVDEKYKGFFLANPITHIIEAFRYGLLGLGTFSWWGLGYATGASILLLVIGLYAFNRVERNFIDTI